VGARQPRTHRKTDTVGERQRCPKKSSLRAELTFLFSYISIQVLSNSAEPFLRIHHVQNVFKSVCKLQTYAVDLCVFSDQFGDQLEH